MANRYWVGGTSVWDNLAGSKWSTTSGGSGGASAPTSSDDVYFDNNSGSNTIITYSSATCKNLTCTGFTGTLNCENGIKIYGSLLFSTTMSVFKPNLKFYSSNSETITTNGKKLFSLIMYGSGTITLQDNLTTDTTSFPGYGYISLDNGIFNANNKNITTGGVYCTNTSNNRTLTMGSGTWTIYNNFNLDATNLTFSDSSTLNFGLGFTGMYLDFSGGGLTFNNVNIYTGDVVRISNNNTFTSLTINPGAIVEFEDGSTQTVVSFSCVGTILNVILLRGVSSTWNISDSSGTNSIKYTFLYNSAATGGATWNADQTNIDGGGNTGWNFFTGINNILPAGVGAFILTGNNINLNLTKNANLITKGNTTFSVGDILRIKDGIDDEWMSVAEVISSTNYKVIRDKAEVYSTNNNPTWKKGATIVNYGKLGDGGVYMTASDTNAPYLSIFDHNGSPWNGLNTRLRIGNLNGYLGYSTDLYGIAIGETDKYLKYDPINGLRIKGKVEIISGSTGVSNLSDAGALALLSVVGNAYITDLSVSKLTAGTITSKAITLAVSDGSGDAKIQAGKTDFGNDSTAGFILGLDDSDGNKAKFEIGSSASKMLKYDGQDLTLTGGIITSGIVRTSNSSTRVEMNSDYNNISIYKNNILIGSFGNSGYGNFMYVTQPNTNEDYPPIYIKSSQSSNIVYIENDNTSVVRPALYVRSNSAYSSTVEFYNNNNFTTLYCVANSAPAANFLNSSNLYGTLYLQNIGTAPLIYNAHNSAQLTKAGVWTDASSVIYKENFEIINVLDKLENLNVFKYNYICDKTEKHFTPTAEDFNEIFGFGNDSTISPNDTAGVALQAIKELYEKFKLLEIKINGIIK